MDGFVSAVGSGLKLVIVTGAGISVPSGIQPYRGTDTAIWSKFLTQWGTKAKFKEDPLTWWNTYWIPTHEKPEVFNATPNPAHKAITTLVTLGQIFVITQNIDRLHAAAGTQLKNLIEVHGHVGWYRCSSNPSDTPHCPGRGTEILKSLNLEDYAVPGTSRALGNLQLASVPLCTSCKAPVLPLALFFDEEYAIHSFFRWTEALDQVAAADGIVFVGTSMNVGVTDMAYKSALKAKKPVFFFNTREDDMPGEEASALTPTYKIVGPSEVTLPTAVATIQELWNSQEMVKSREAVIAAAHGSGEVKGIGTRAKKRKAEGSGWTYPPAKSQHTASSTAKQKSSPPPSPSPSSQPQIPSSSLLPSSPLDPPSSSSSLLHHPPPSLSSSSDLATPSTLLSSSQTIASTPAAHPPNHPT